MIKTSMVRMICINLTEEEAEILHSIVQHVGGDAATKLCYKLCDEFSSAKIARSMFPEANYATSLRISYPKKKE